MTMIMSNADVNIQDNGSIYIIGFAFVNDEDNDRNTIDFKHGLDIWVLWIKTVWV